MKFARWVFWIAGLYGLLVLLPQFAAETQIGQDYPPAITHAEYFYGFLGVAIAWQVAFLVIATDPARYRPLLPATFIEKFSFTAVTQWMFWKGQLASIVMVFGLIDALLGALFVAAYFATAPAAEPRESERST